MNSADPRSTAYALGELDPADRAAFERALASDPDLQADVQSLGALADALSRQPANEAHRLTSAQRARLLAGSASRVAPGIAPAARFRRAVGLLAMAACVIFALVLTLRVPVGEPSTQGNVPLASAASPEPLATPIALALSPSAAISKNLAETRIFEGQGRLDLAKTRQAETVGDDAGNPASLVIADRIERSRAHYAQAVQALEPPATLDVALAQSPRIATSLPAQPVPTSKPQAAPVGRMVAIAPAELNRGNTASGMVATVTDTRALGESRRELSASPALPGSATAGGFGFANGAAAPGVIPRPQPPADADTESYAPISAATFQTPADQPLSTFSIDVDTASYANVRRFLQAGQRPPADAVRIEELLNYFPAALPPPAGDAPFSITTDVTRAPWATDRLLARVALKGRQMPADSVPPSNLVFLVDVSGSMEAPNKLPLLQRSLRGLVEQLRPDDRVAIVTYAGASGVALPSTEAREKSRILAAIDALQSGGSTNGASGITLAYETARAHFLRQGNNRVILCTDGDFNVGVTSRNELTALIERERRSGVFLSVLGFGAGNLKDATMELLANRGNGNYAYIDSIAEGRKVLVEEMGATLFTIAKDVKIQVEFNPATVAGYRLLGYENRLLAREDFNDDTKDAGEIGAGHRVTALYEIIPAGQPLPNDRRVDPLKYQVPAEENPKSKIQNPNWEDLFTVKLRFKAPDGDRSELLERVVGPEVTPFENAPADLRFAAAVAAFGMNLRAGPGDTATEWSAVQRIARDAMGDDPGAHRAEFLTLVERARTLTP